MEKYILRTKLNLPNLVSQVILDLKLLYIIYVDNLDFSIQNQNKIEKIDQTNDFNTWRF